LVPLSGGEDGFLGLWARLEEGHEIEGVIFGSDGKQLFSGDTDETLRLWDLRRNN